MMKKYITDKCLEYLGDSWHNYGLEIAETAEKVVSKLDSIDNLDGYIRTSLANAIYYKYRTEGRLNNKEVPLDDYQIDKVVSSHIDTDTIHTDHAVRKHLGEEMLRIRKLRTVDGYTIAEIAEHTGLTIKEVRGRLTKLDIYLRTE